MGLCTLFFWFRSSFSVAMCCFFFGGLCHMFFLGSSVFFPGWCTMSLWKFEMSTTAIDSSNTPALDSFRSNSLIIWKESAGHVPPYDTNSIPPTFLYFWRNHPKNKVINWKKNPHFTWQFQVQHIISFTQMSWSWDVCCFFLKHLFNTLGHPKKHPCSQRKARMKNQPFRRMDFSFAPGLIFPDWNPPQTPSRWHFFSRL